MELKQGSEASERYWSQKDMGDLSLSRKENHPRGSEVMEHLNKGPIFFSHML